MVNQPENEMDRSRPVGSQSLKQTIPALHFVKN